MSDSTLLEAEEKMEKSVNVVDHEFQSVRTGKASSALVENLQVTAYGTKMRMRDLAGITTPEPRLIVIQPFDAANVVAVEKAIADSNLGISPRIDGKILRLVIPELSEDRRKELDKVIKKMAEDGRIAIRQVRREAMDQVKHSQKDGKISEDEMKGAEKEIQRLTDEYIAKIDQLLSKKEKEIMTV
ncbi:MAG: ribosome recycling factor [Verrucomicrobiae bacterium]|nr:ribosome recycling factor [Verrucomicrobiae bacterium]